MEIYGTNFFLKNSTYFVIVRNLRNMSETSIIFYITASYDIPFLIIS